MKGSIRVCLTYSLSALDSVSLPRKHKIHICLFGWIQCSQTVIFPLMKHVSLLCHIWWRDFDVSIRHLMSLALLKIILSKSAPVLDSSGWDLTTHQDLAKIAQYLSAMAKKVLHCWSQMTPAATSNAYIPTPTTTRPRRYGRFWASKLKIWTRKMKWRKSLARGSFRLNITVPGIVVVDPAA